MRIFRNNPGSTVRLYFYNFVGNVLDDAQTISAYIKSGNIIIFNLNPTRESKGVYYVEFIIPSADPANIYYNPKWQGAGIYEDVWNVNGTPFTQNFVILDEVDIPIVEKPFEFSYALSKNTFNIGSQDFIRIILTEKTGQLEIENYPNLYVRLLSASENQLRNYKIANRINNEYFYFLDSTSLAPGTYYIQGKIIIPESVINKKAEILGTNNKSLIPEQPYEILDLDIDGIKELVTFPNTGKKASAIFHIPSVIDFRKTSNDVFKILVEGQERSIRLVNLPNPRTGQSIFYEFNGLDSILPLSLTYPITTSGLDLSTLDLTTLNFKNLILKIDNQIYIIEFNGFDSNSTLNDLATSINTAVGKTIAYILTGSVKLLALANKIVNGVDTFTYIEVISGTALRDLGFVEGQKDTKNHKISDNDIIVTYDNANNKIKISSSAKSFKILDYDSGSTATPYLGFNAGEYNPIPPTPPQITSDNVSQPIQVITKKPARYIVSRVNSTLTKQEKRTLNGKSIKINNTTITFNKVTPPAIVSPLKQFSYTFDSASNFFRISDATIDNGNWKTITITPAETYNLFQIVNKLNNEFSANNLPLTADIFNSSLRIRRNSPFGNNNYELKIDINSSTSPAALILGFSYFPDPNAEANYQNDQVIISGSEVIAKDYINTIEPEDIVNTINSNTSINSTIISYINSQTDQIVIETKNFGSNQSFTIRAIDNEVQTILDISTDPNPNPLTGENSLNEDMTISLIDTSTNQSIADATVLFTDGFRDYEYIANTINSQTDIVTAILSDDKSTYTIKSSATGSNIKIEITSQSWDGKRFGFSANYDNNNNKVSIQNGSDLQPAVAESIDLSTLSSIRFRSVNNAFLLMKSNIAQTIYTKIDLSSSATSNDISNAINNAFPGVFSINVDSNNNKIIITVNNPNDSIIIASTNEGSTANTTLGIDSRGIIIQSISSNEYTIDDIVRIINAIIGREVAFNEGGFLRLNSIIGGSTSYIKIGVNTTRLVLDRLGLSKGKVYGSTTKRSYQEIVLDKLSLVLSR